MRRKELISSSNMKARPSKNTLQKCREAQGAVQVILYALVGLLLCTLPFGIGLRGVQATTREHLQQISDRMSIHKEEVIRHLHVIDGITTLTSYPLKEQLFEDHTACLARGINSVSGFYMMWSATPPSAVIHGEANDYLNYPEVVNRAIAWVKDSCDTWHFSPQKKQSSYRFPNIRNGWTFIQRHTQRILALVNSWRRRDRNVSGSGRNGFGNPPDGKGSSNAQWHPDHDTDLPDLPPHFHFNCSASRCRVEFESPAFKEPPELNVTRVRETLKTLSSALEIQTTTLVLTDFTTTMLICTQGILLLSLLVLQILDPPLAPITGRSLLHPDTWEGKVRATVINALLFFFCVGMRVADWKLGGHYSMVLALHSMLFGFVMLLNFLFPLDTRLPHIGHWVYGVADLAGLVISRPSPTACPVAITATSAAVSPTARPSSFTSRSTMKKAGTIQESTEICSSGVLRTTPAGEQCVEFMITDAEEQAVPKPVPGRDEDYLVWCQVTNEKEQMDQAGQKEKTDQLEMMDQDEQTREVPAKRAHSPSNSDGSWSDVDYF